MTKSYCLDTSVIVPLLVPEPTEDKARLLFHEIRSTASLIYLPSFAWAEVGSVLRKKVRKGVLGPERGAETWKLFRSLPMIRYLQTDAVIRRAWDISALYGLDTLYDAAFLAVTEYVERQTAGQCEYWTADEVLVKQLSGQLPYVRLLSSLTPEQ